MEQEMNVGIYFLDEEGTDRSLLFFKDLEEYAKTLPRVANTWTSHAYPHCAECISGTIEKMELTRIVLVGQYPGKIKQYFSQLLDETGFSDVQVELLSFAELGLEMNEPDAVRQALKKKIDHSLTPVVPSWNGHQIHPDTMVIGAGIAGIQASLEISNAGKKVILVEKQGTIGGHMAMFDKTFPTLDCAACILTPKMVDIGQNPNIELMTYSVVKEVSGIPGKFKVKVLKKARFVDEKLCIGCGSCAAKCPSKTPSEFDAATTLRKAIYMPFPQAVPNKYLIDKDHCNYILSDGEKCGVCVKFCPVNDCIDLHQKDEVVEMTVGNIILATGFKPFDASRIERYGYGQYPNVLTSLELERLINAGGPTEGKITTRSIDKKGNPIFTKDNPQPGSVALVHCIGSRDENYNKYCSSVCCMYSLKLAHLVKEKLPAAEVSEYFIDMRAFGKGYEEFYQRIAGEGVHIIRGKTATVEQHGNKLRLRSEDIIANALIEQDVDMVVLSVGLEPAHESSKLAKMLGIKQDCNGWFTEANFLSEPSSTNIPGIHVAGVCQGPKDIPDTVVQAAAAAARVLQSIETRAEVIAV